MRTAAILVSRQALRPCGKTLWVRQVIRAVEWVHEEGLTLVTSVGMQTWDMITTAATIKDVPIKIVIPEHNENNLMKIRENITQSFGCRPSDLMFVNSKDKYADDEKKTLWRARDEEIIASADVIIPVSISPSGNMANLIRKYSSCGKTIITDFQITHHDRKDKLAYSVVPSQLNPLLDEFRDTHIVHWTRGCNTGWPDERAIDYYQDIINSTTYPRTALDTLMRIIKSGRIIASSRKMPEGIPTVSFSAQPPAEAIKLMRWRARYREMSMEPYGIGISRSIAEQREIIPVHYYDKDEKNTESTTERWLTQSRGKITDWSDEMEFRHRGDIDLNKISSDDIQIFCHTPSEVDMFFHEMEHKAISIIK